MNAVISATRYVVEHAVRRRILTEAYLDPASSWRPVAPISLEAKVRQTTIEGRVLMDCHQVGGREMLVSLSGLPREYSDEYTTVIRVPPNRVDNRRILSVLSVSYYPNTAALGAVSSNSGILNAITQSDVNMAGWRVGDSFGNVPHISAANVEVEGNNTIIIRDRVRTTGIYELRCIVGNNDNLSNLNVRNYLVFNQLCALAAKAYCYNRLIIDVDEGRLEGGRSLGEFKNQLDQYADAEELYIQKLEEDMHAIFWMNDTPAYERYIAVQMNPGL